MTTKFKVGDIVQVVKVEDGMLVFVDNSMRKYVGHPYQVVRVKERQEIDEEYCGNYDGDFCDYYTLLHVSWYDYPENVKFGSVDIWEFTEDMLGMYDENI